MKEVAHILTEDEIRRARVLVAQIGDAFSHYINGAGYAVHELLKLAPRFLDEVEAFRGYDKELDEAGLRTGALVTAFEAEIERLRAEVERLRESSVNGPKDLGDQAERIRRERACENHRAERDALRAEVERLRFYETTSAADAIRMLNEARAEVERIRKEFAEYVIARVDVIGRLPRIKQKLLYLVRDYPGDKETRGLITTIDAALASEAKEPK